MEESACAAEAVDVWQAHAHGAMAESGGMREEKTR